MRRVLWLIAKLIIAIILLGVGFLIFWLFTLKIPDFNAIDTRLVAESTKIYDRTGKVLLYSVQEGVRRKVVPFGDISKQMKNASVAIEDAEFYNHRGVKLESIIRAFFANLQSGSYGQGGSTITQQVVKNSLLTTDKTIARKLKEWILAVRLEQVMSKDEILGWYLNEIPYGGNIYGVEEASQSFFGVSAKDLSLTQAAYLAAIPKAPTFYSPYGLNRAKLDGRKNLVLERMRALGFISEAEYATAKAEVVTFRLTNDNSLRAPHFVMLTRSYLEERYGADTIRNRGFKVITTLDWNLQQKAEAAIAHYGASHEKSFNAKNTGLVAIDPNTGQILAMVGSRDYFDTKNDGNFNVTLGHRQPGSSFKPFVYATAFNEGYTPETMLFDLPTQFDTNCANDPTKCYTPVNYDGKYRGPISLRSALAQSINVPAVKLLYLAGIADSIRTARSMGIESLGNANQYGLPLVLGGGAVSLLDLTSAYGVFATEGVRHPAEKILRVEDASGAVLESFADRPQKILSENTARLISDILSDDTARAPMFGRNSPLHFPNYEVAVKTGTSDDRRDAWVVGYTPNLVAGAWVGNNDNSPMAKKASGLIITPLWHEFFASAIANRPVQQFTPPEPTSPALPPVYRGRWEGGISYYLDKISGLRATDNTPPELRVEKVVRQIHSILYWLNRQSDSQFQFWEPPIRQWAMRQGLVDETEVVIPQEVDNIHLPELAPRVAFSETIDGRSYSPDSKISVALRDLGSRFPLAQADYFLNGEFLGSVKQSPFAISFKLSDSEIIQTINELKVVVYDGVRNQTTLNQKLLNESPAAPAGQTGQ
ncbi:MAG: transglycosylase domain-containing protein [Candidatus Vogelbacteria bacterium]